MSPVVQLWLPLAVIRRSEEICGSTRLQKLVFLAEVEGHLGNFMGFKQHKYGPFSQQLHNMTRGFQQMGYLECGTEAMPEGYEDRHDYCLTEKGKEFLAQLEEEFSFLALLADRLDILERYENMQTHELRRYVYSKYLPDDPDDPAIYPRRMTQVEEMLESYTSAWSSFEQEHFPVSYYVLAVLEHTEEILEHLSRDDSSLDNNVLLNSIHYLLKQVWSLLDALERTDSPEPEEDPDVRVVYDELRDILEFVDERASKASLVKSFSRLTIDDLTPVE